MLSVFVALFRPHLLLPSTTLRFSSAMHFITRVRKIFQKKAPELVLLPRDWPSNLHSKCDSPTCGFPNPPQAAEGTYNCQGFPCCSGTYHVSAAMAASVIRSYSFGWSREAVEKAASSSTPSLGRAASIKSIKHKASRRFNKSKQKDLPAIPGLHIRSGSLSSGPNSPVRTLPPSTPSSPTTSSTPPTPTTPTRSTMKGGFHQRLFQEPEPISPPFFGGGKATVSPVPSPTREISQPRPPRNSARHHVPRSVMKHPYPRGNASAPSLNMF